MKKLLILVLVLLMIMGLSIPTFAGKSDSEWVNNINETEEEVNEELVDDNVNAILDTDDIQAIDAVIESIIKALEGKEDEEAATKEEYEVFKKDRDDHLDVIDEVVAEAEAEEEAEALGNEIKHSKVRNYFRKNINQYSLIDAINFQITNFKYSEIVKDFKSYKEYWKYR